uniref:hypothetical protein n=1 Tax=Nonomuraea phyllanthi TaxID=2219224 RepID=UPI001293F058
MEILAAFDLTGSYRKAAVLVGCDQHTVPRYVSFARRAKLNEGFRAQDRRAR